MAVSLQKHTLNQCGIWQGCVSYDFGRDQVFDGRDLVWLADAASDATGWTSL